MPKVSDSKISTVAGIKSLEVIMVQSLNAQCVALDILNNRGNPTSRIGPRLENTTSMRWQSVVGLLGHISHIICLQDKCSSVYQCHVDLSSLYPKHNYTAAGETLALAYFLIIVFKLCDSWSRKLERFEITGTCRCFLAKLNSLPEFDKS